MVITDITVTKAGRYSIFVDGDFVFAVEPATFEDMKIKKGMTVSSDELNAILTHTKTKEARKKAYSLLSERSYTKKKLTDKLAAIGGKDLASDTAEYMEEIGLVDDTDYAIRYSRELYNRKFYSLKRIKYELKQKGISNDGIDIALEQFDSDDSVTNAVAFLRKKRYDLTDDRGRKRAFDALLRLGYSFSEAKTAVGVCEEDFEEELEEEYGY